MESFNVYDFHMPYENLLMVIITTHIVCKKLHIIFMAHRLLIPYSIT
jgi:hypothetical protein